MALKPLSGRGRKGATARPHDYARCRDAGCDRVACEAFREGREEGYEDGYEDGLEAGFRAAEAGR